MKWLLYLLFCFLLFSCANNKTVKTGGTISAGKFQVYYETEGEGDAVLLLHAGLQNNTMWAEQIKALSENHKVIRIDLPFHGNTTGSDTIYAKDVVKTILDSLHVNKVSVVGLSMGAAVAQDFAIHYPGMVNKLVLMASGIYGYEEHHKSDSLTLAWYPKFVEALNQKDTAKAALVFAKTWGDGLVSTNDSLRKPASRWVYEMTLENLKKHKAAGWPNLVDEPKAYAGIGKLSMPVLVIHGDQDLPFITETCMYLEKTIPNARRVLLKGAAHMINLEQPEEVNRLLVEFFTNTR